MSFPPRPGGGGASRFSGASKVVPLGTGLQAIAKNVAQVIFLAPSVPVYDTAGDNYFAPGTPNGGFLAPFDGPYRIDASAAFPRLGPGIGPGAWSLAIVADGETPFGGLGGLQETWAVAYSFTVATGGAQSDPQLFTSRSMFLDAGQGVDLYAKWEGDGAAGSVNMNGLQSLTVAFLAPVP